MCQDRGRNEMRNTHILAHSFDYLRPVSLPEALTALTECPEAKILAGGTNLLVDIKLETSSPPEPAPLEEPGELTRQLLGERPKTLVDISRLTGLSGIETGAGGTTIGALTSIRSLAVSEPLWQDHSCLAEAAAAFGSTQVAMMGTLGGNLCLDTRCHWINQSEEWRRACGFCLKKDGDVCHVARGSSTCLAAYSGDLAPALIALDADVTLRSAEGERTVPLDAFFVDDGGQRTVRHADELLTQIRVPAHRANLGGSYGKLRGRNAIDFPLAGVAVAGRIDDDGRFRDIAIALTATAPRPIRVPAVREMLEGEPADDALIEAAAERVARAAKPLETSTCFSPSYRRHRVRLLARDGLRAL